MFLRQIPQAVLLLGACLLAVPCSIAQSSGGPSLFRSEQDIQRAVEKARQQPWAAKAEEDILKAAAAFPESYEKRFGLQTPELPPEGGQWGHYYVCPNTGSRLQFHPPDMHVCPDDGKIYKNQVFQQVSYSQRADALERAARSLALAYRITGNRHYAEEAASILKEYGKRYLTYKLHTRMGTSEEARVYDETGRQLESLTLVNANADAGARVFEQTLEESVWLIQMAWAYDLVRDSGVLSAADRKLVEDGFLRPAAGVVSRAIAPTLNWQVWDDTALAAVGYTLGDQEMITRAIDGPDGALPYLRKYLVDGFWIEGSWNYQFYTMGAYYQLAEMALQHGRSLWQQEPMLKAMFASPIGVTLPNGDLPAFNDSDVHNLRNEAPLYEAAYSATNDAVFAAILMSSKRENEQALLFGAANIPKENLPKPSSTLFKEIGFGRLTASDGDLTEVMKFGPHGGVHGHFDELSNVIYSQGRLMSVDPGTQAYGLPLHSTWDKQTVAHNTVAMDETTQLESTGKLIDWQVTPKFTTLKADAGPVYKNVSLTRRVVLTPHYILEITTAAATDRQMHTFDWVYHNVGEQHIDLPVQPWSGFAQKAGYQHLSSNRSAIADGLWQTEFHAAADATAGAGNMHLLMAAEPGTRVITGNGFGPDLRVTVPYVMARRKAQMAQFVVVIEPHPGAPVIKSIESLGNGKYKITAADWLDQISAGDHVSLEHSGKY